MASAAPKRGNDWKTQPRDIETGRWAPRKREQPRREVIKIRVSAAERREIELGAQLKGKTLTRYLLDAALGAEKPTEPKTMTALEMYEHVAALRRRR